MLQKQQQLYGNEDFTYTLIDKWLTNQFMWKYSIYATAVATALGFIGYGWWLIYKKAK
jgi:hypothetical protein